MERLRPAHYVLQRQRLACASSSARPAAMVYMRLVRVSLDLLVFTSVPLLLLLTAADASWWPACRAVRIDPVAALRAQ